jgi:hypothetical protein
MVTSALFSEKYCFNSLYWNTCHNASLFRYIFIQHTKNYYFKSNRSLKFHFLSFFKNLENSPSQRYMREKRTTTLQVWNQRLHWLIDYLRLDFTIAGEGLQNLGLCSALRAFEEGGIFIVPHLLWHWARFFRSHPENPPLTTHEGMWRRIYSNLDPHWATVTEDKGLWNCFFCIFDGFIALDSFWYYEIINI